MKHLYLIELEVPNYLPREIIDSYLTRSVMGYAEYDSQIAFEKFDRPSVRIRGLPGGWKELIDDDTPLSYRDYQNLLNFLQVCRKLVK